MFKTKEEKPQNKSVYTKHFMRIIAVDFLFDVFATKREAQRFYTQNYNELGVALNFADVIEQNDEFVRIQNSTYKPKDQPDPSKFLVVQYKNGVRFVYLPETMEIKDQKEVQKFQEQVQKLI